MAEAAGDGGAEGALAAGDGVEGFLDFGDGFGFEEVTGGAGAEGGPVVVFVLVAGEEEDAGLRKFFGNAGGEFEAMEAGHINGGDEQGGAMLADEVEGLAAVGGLLFEELKVGELRVES